MAGGEGANGGSGDARGHTVARPYPRSPAAGWRSVGKPVAAARATRRVPEAAPARDPPTESDVVSQDIARWIREGTGSAIIESAAGAGKTTALLRALEALDDRQTWAILMFNRRIQEEVAVKAHGAKAKSRSVFTFHALAYKILWEHVKKLAGQPNADMPQAAYESLLNLGLNADSTTDAVDINVVGSRESLLIVDKRKMDKVLEQLHAEEGAAANRRGIQPPQPTIQELAKAFDLANLISTCRNHGIAPPLQPVQDLIVDTDLDLANLVQPLSDPPVPCPTDFDTLFEWSGINFKERGKKFPEFSEEELEQRVKTVLGMALRRSLGSVLKPGQSQYVVDYEDLIYVPVLAKGVDFFSYDFVFVDEAQDLSRLRIGLIKQLVAKSRGRVVAVGDRHQSVFGFTGSLPNSLDHLPHAFGELTEFNLPVTWRCPQLHVAFARAICASFGEETLLKARPGALLGVLEYRSKVWDLDDVGAEEYAREIVKEGSLLIARGNKTLHHVGGFLASIGFPHTCSAENLGAKILYFLRTHANLHFPSQPHPNHPRTAQRLSEFQFDDLNKEFADIAKTTNRIISRLLKEAGPLAANLTLHDLQRELFRIFPALSSSFGGKDILTITHLSTIHQAKGLGRDRVIFLQPSDCPSNRSIKDWEREQETNLLYVAATRSKSDLILVDIASKSLAWRSRYSRFAENAVRIREAVDKAQAALRPVVPEFRGFDDLVLPRRSPRRRKAQIQELRNEMTPLLTPARLFADPEPTTAAHLPVPQINGRKPASPALPGVGAITPSTSRRPAGMSAAAATFAKKRPGGIQEWTPVSGHNSKKAKTPVAMREEPKSPTKPLSAPGSQTERVLFSGDTIEDSEGSEPESDFETKPPSLKWETEDILDYENTAKRQRKRPSLAAGRKPSLI